MINWLKRIKCILFGHEVIVGDSCPVTGIKKLTCTDCGETNVPKHSGESRFN
jgi:hypothetical protein